MEEGIEIPIGGDWSALQASFDAVIASINKLGDRIAASFEKSNACVAATIEKMARLQSSSNIAAAAQQKTATAAASTGEKLMIAGRATVALARMTTGLGTGLANVATIMSSLSGANFGNMLVNLTRLGSGFKGAIQGAWIALKQLGTSRSFWQIAAGATAAIGAIIAIRTAWRTAAGGVHLLTSAANAAFRGIISGARNTASIVSGAFRGIVGIPGKLLSIPGLPIAGLVSAAGAMALFTSQMKNGMDTASQFEKAGISLEALTGSGQKAVMILDSIRASWLRTGATLQDQAPNIQKFLALGFTPTNALKLQQSILDISGAVGMSTDEARLLGSALAQVQAKGVVSMEELRQQIAEKGVPVFETLAAKIGVSQAALMKLVSDGKVPAKSLIDIFLNMEGAFARFRGGADKLGNTFSGLVSRLRGAWDILLSKFAAPINDALKPVLQNGIDKITSLMTKAEELGTSVAKTISSLFGVFERGESIQLFKAGLNVAFLSAVDVLNRGFLGAVAFLATTLPPVIAAAFAKFTDPLFWAGLAKTFQGLGNIIAASIRAALPNALLNAKDISEQYKRGLDQQKRGIAGMERAGNVDLSEVIRKILLEGKEAAAKAAGGPKSRALLDAEALVKKLMDAGLRRVQAEQSADEIFGKLLNKSTTAISKSNTDSLADNVGRAATPAVMSLTRIGGGGFANTVMSNLIAETKRQTGYLKTIANNTAGKTIPATSAYA